MLINEPKNEYDVLIIGGGIAGIEAALTLADMGFKVILVEKTPSVGGKMALLSKVFPTLDCASCIATPKMAAVLNNENVDLLVYSEVSEINRRVKGDFDVVIKKKATYVDFDKCTACELCEKACPIVLSDEFNYGLKGRKAVYIAFDIAVPKKAIVDIEHCMLCGLCEKVCPPGAMNFLDEDREYNIKAKAVIISTGFELFDPLEKPEFKYKKFKNVITSIQMDRLLSPTSPFGGVARPSDLKEPENIAIVLCVGSRDLDIGYPLCSQVCCMYSIKQAQLILGALPLADTTIFYIDIRAFGKGFEEFYNQTKLMGVRFVKGQVDILEEKENGDIVVRYYDHEDGEIKEEVFDLVVLAVGVRPNRKIAEMFRNVELKFDEYGWIKEVEPNLEPTRTSIPGVFVAGAASGPKDIPDSIVEANAAAISAAAYILKNFGWRRTK